MVATARRAANGTHCCWQISNEFDRLKSETNFVPNHYELTLQVDIGAVVCANDAPLKN